MQKLKQVAMRDVEQDVEDVYMGNVLGANVGQVILIVAKKITNYQGTSKTGCHFCRLTVSRQLHNSEQGLCQWFKIHCIWCAANSIGIT